MSYGYSETKKENLPISRFLKFIPAPDLQTLANAWGLVCKSVTKYWRSNQTFSRDFEQNDVDVPRLNIGDNSFRTPILLVTLQER